LFHLAQYIKQFRRIDLGDGPFAQSREDISAKALTDMIGIARGPFLLLRVKPFQCNGERWNRGNIANKVSTTKAKK